MNICYSHMHGSVSPGPGSDWRSTAGRGELLFGAQLLVGALFFFLVLPSAGESSQGKVRPAGQ